MIRALIDTNVILDVVLNRKEHVESSALVFRQLRTKRFVGYIAATSVTTIDYVTRKIDGRSMAEQAVEKTLENFEVISINRNILYSAWKTHQKDFEDAVQAMAAKEAGIDIVVTRDKTGFANSGLRVYKPEEFLELLKQEKQRAGDGA